MNRIKDIFIVIVCVVFVLKVCDINLSHRIPIDQHYLPAGLNTNTHSYLAYKQARNVELLSDKVFHMINKAI